MIYALDEWMPVVDAYLKRQTLPHSEVTPIVARTTKDGNPIPLEAYLGTWTGKWSATDAGKLHIESITPSGELQGYSQYKRQKKRRFSTTLDEQGVLYVVNQPGKILSGFYLNQNMTMVGHFHTPLYIRKMYLTHR